MVRVVVCVADSVKAICQTMGINDELYVIDPRAHVTVRSKAPLSGCISYTMGNTSLVPRLLKDSLVTTARACANFSQN